MARIKEWFKQLFCRHEYRMTRWHWTHGPNGNDPRDIEREYRCSKCGKLIYDHITNDMCSLESFAERNSETRW